MTDRDRSTAMRVGVFLAVGLAMAAAAIFMIGEKSGLFARKITLHAYFEDISGLVPGAPVRLAGLAVGTVSEIQFPDEIERQQARVTLSVESSYMERVRENSRAFIDSKGLLGDKIVNITLGTASQPQLQDGDTIKTRESLSMESLANNVEGTLTSIGKLSRSVNEAVQELDVATVQKDVNRVVSTTADILEEVKTGDGLLHRLLYDPDYAERLARAVDETSNTMARVGHVADGLDRTLAAIEEGPGTLHELVHGQEGVEAIRELRAASTELSSMMHEIREGEGLAHALLYDPQGQQILDELHAASQRIDRMTANIEKGRGTLGGLVVDPSVYEDLKSILGNIERNVALKALMRFAIKEGDIERPAYVPESRPAEPTGEADTGREAEAAP